MKTPVIRASLDDLLHVFRDGKERTVNDVRVRLKCSEDVARRLLRDAVKQGALEKGIVYMQRQSIQTWKPPHA